MVVSGCAARQHKMPETFVWRLTRCVQNGEHTVCECSVYKDVRDAKTGNLVRICD